MATMMPEPSAPPNAACGSNAATTIKRNASPKTSKFITRMARHPKAYAAAIKGTRSSHTLAMFLIPPTTTSATRPVIIAPMTQLGTPFMFDTKMLVIACD